MRINLIGNLNKGTGLAQDIQILHGILAHVLGKETEFRHVPHYHPQCMEAEVNVFIEAINPSLFVYAAKNIWIPNPEWTQQTWAPYARMVDEIWVKTREAERLFQDLGKVRYIGWTSIDKTMPDSKNYNKAIAPVGKNVWRNPKPIVQAYMRVRELNMQAYLALPELHLVYNAQVVPLPPIPDVVRDKIVSHPEPLTEEAYDALLKECGLCICTSASEGFGHAVNEAMSTGANLLLSPIDAFMELTKSAAWVSEKASTPHPSCMGVLLDVDVHSLAESLIFYLNTSIEQRIQTSHAMRKTYEVRHNVFMSLMTDVIKGVIADLPTYSLQDRLPKEADLPPISVITLTRDRRVFMPLAKFCFMGLAYPDDKIEWVIVDDGKDQIKDLISDVPNVKYVLVDEPLTIGAKRNLGVASASHDILVMMDDDDVYPNNSAVSRVAHMLAEPRKECVFSTTIPCYEIHEAKSFMNVPPMALHMSERVSEATLCFTRAFWEARKFPEQQVAEGDAFIRGREHMCRELSPQDVIVSLIHKKNTSARKPPPMAEPNGCHYGFADQLFTLVSEIGMSIR
jgi:hypothetical protein